ncbi:MAG: MFS transporter [Deltaproteobacteria bacterium]|nr:MAG: MFS transporter [Deltaproteobacteria bacterium]
MSTTRLLFDRRFWPLFWVQFLTAFNDNVLKMGLVLLVTYGDSLFGEPVTVLGFEAGPLNGLGGLMLMLPYLLFSASAGQLADKLPKHRIMRGVKTAEIGIMTLAAAGFVVAAWGWPEPAALVLLGVVFLAGTQSSVFGPVKYSLIPQVLPSPGELVAGNALIETGTYISVLAGTAAATALLVGPEQLGWPPIYGLYVLAGGLLVFSLAGWLAARAQAPVPAEQPDLQVRWEPFSTSFATVKANLVDPKRRYAILANSWFWAVGATVLTVVPTWVANELSADEITNTFTMILFSVGIGVGSMLCARWSRGRLEMGLVVVGAIGITVFLFDLWLAGVPWPRQAELLTLSELATRPAAWRLAFDLVGLAMSGGIFMVPLYAYLQHEGPPGERAQIIGALNLVNAAFIVGALLLVTVTLALGVSEPWVFLALAILNIGWIVASYRTLADRFLRLLAEVLVNLMFRMRVEGQHHLPEEEPCLIVANHVSYVDFMILMAVVHRRHRFVIWHAFTTLPVAKTLTRQYDVIPVNNEGAGRAALVRAFREMSKALREGEAVIIFPEGALPYEPGVQPFMRGLEVVLKRDPVPVVPVVLHGLWGSMYSRDGGRAFRRWPRLRRKIWITICPPIAPEGQTSATLRDRIVEIYQSRPQNP